MRYGICSVLIAALVSVSLADISQAAPFDRWDKNGDGRLTKDELPERIRGNFDRADTNDDGFISRREDAAVRNRIRKRREKGRRDRNSWRGMDNVKAKLNVSYAGNDNPRQQLDLFLPEKPETDGPLPTIVFIHGGAWRAGNKITGRRRVAQYVKTGKYAGASIGYRLTNEETWPAQIHDCKAAIRWLKANAEEYNLDADRIGVWGSSAGGHLVAMLGVAGDVKGLEGDLGDTADFDSSVACVVDWFGSSDLLAMGKYPSKMNHEGANSPESRLVGGLLRQHKEVARNASPITYVSRGDAPFLIMHGTEDPVVPFNQSVRLDVALKKAKVPSIFVKVVGARHGGFGNPEADERVSRFFRKHLLGEDIEVSGEPLKAGKRR